MRLTLHVAPGLAPHSRAVMLAGGTRGGRKVAVLTDENRNPLRPKNSTEPAKPFSLDLFLPLYLNAERVEKFRTEEAALAFLTRLLAAIRNDLINEENR